MRIPKKVKILYKNYIIEKQKNLHDENGDLYGQICYLPERILLNEDSSEEQQRATLIHEMIHGMDEMFNIRLKERQVEKLGNALYMLIEDNPDIFEKGEDAI